MTEIPVRHSARKRQAPDRLSQDALADLDLLDDQLMADDGEGEGEGDDGGDDDDEFMAEVRMAAAVDESVSDLPRHGVQGPADVDDEDELDLEDADVDYAEGDTDASDGEKPSQRRDRAGARWPTQDPASKALYSRSRYGRGLLDPKLRASKEAIRRSLHGPDLADQKPALQNVYKWRREQVLPSRRADRSGAGGYHRTFYQSDVQCDAEMTRDWKWYDEDSGRESLQHLQIFEHIDLDTAQEYMPQDSPEQEVILGPYGSQQSFKIPRGGVLELNDPFAEHIARLQPEAQASCKRNGWLLNLGQRIQSIAWVPNQAAAEQYLAVTTVPFRNPVKPIPGTDGQTPSAFQPQPPTKTAIQIWQVNADGQAYINLDHRPRLRQVICTDWGDAKLLKWCMMPRKYDGGDASGKHLGLLASVWGDGAVRVVTVTLKSSSVPTQYLRLQSAPFCARPPSGVFTSVAWLSSHSICAGTSQGSVAIFDITSHLQSTSVVACADPLVYSPLQSSYIISITSCYPSRPHMLATTSLAGCLSLTDLTRVIPATGFTPSNTVLGPRSRVSRSTLAWHDWSQTLLSCDENGTMHGLPLRRFFGYTGLTRFRSGVSALAASECHPFVAAAGHGGEVTTSNITQRTMSTKEPTWSLRWFKHEWRRAVAPDLKLSGLDGEQMSGFMTDNADTEEVNGDDSEQARKGLVRITEGYKAETVMLLKDNKTVPAGTYAISEPQTAATTVAWNPNLHVGGWIAAGMASGLLRIEDIGVDVPSGW